MTPLNLNEIEKKAYRLSNQDGLLEVMIGILLIAFGATFGSGLSVLPMLVAVFIFPRFLEAVRTRCTYPRIGYVRLQQDEPKKTAIGMFGYLAVALAVMFISFLLLGKLKDVAAYKKWSPALMGVLLLGGLIYAHSKSGSNRYIVLALLAVVSGILFSLLNFESHNGLIANFFVMGAIFVVTGFTIFILFLRRYPKQLQEVINGSQ